VYVTGIPVRPVTAEVDVVDGQPLAVTTDLPGLVERRLLDEVDVVRQRLSVETGDDCVQRRRAHRVRGEFALALRAVVVANRERQRRPGVLGRVVAATGSGVVERLVVGSPVVGSLVAGILG